MSKHLLVGAHTSIQGGIQNALYEGQKISATTIQLFTANQRQWAAKPIDKETLSLWKKALAETKIEKVMSHASYLINLGSPDPLTLSKSKKAFEEEILRCHELNIPYLNFHPGAAVGSDEQSCLETIVDSLLSFEKLLSKGSTRLLIETTAGQGSVVGYSFEHLQFFIEKCKAKIPIGICIDTCHIFAAGYDIRTEEAFEKTMKTFNDLVGFSHLFAFHVNDSLQDLGSRKDRHAFLGKGKIGLKSFSYLMNHLFTKDLPKYLETPDPDLWPEEISLLKKFATTS
jgi:deoxyribonuclease-4